MDFPTALASMETALTTPNLEATGVTYEVGIGDQHIDDVTAPPRITIIPTGSIPLGQIQQGPKGTGRVLVREASSFDAIFWTVSASQADQTDYSQVQLMRAVFNATMRSVFGSLFQLKDSSYISVRGQSTFEYGRQLLQRFTLETCLIDTGDIYATVTAALDNVGVTTAGSVNYPVP